jgi:hypothetical protein
LERLGSAPASQHDCADHQSTQYEQDNQTVEAKNLRDHRAPPSVALPSVSQTGALMCGCLTRIGAGDAAGGAGNQESPTNRASSRIHLRSALMETDYLVKADEWMMQTHGNRADRPSPHEILQDNLCQLGESSWDLVAVTPDGHGRVLWVFKKPAKKRVTQRSFNTGAFGETQA